MALSNPHETYINRIKAGSIFNSPLPERRKYPQALLDIEKNRLDMLDKEGR